VEGVFGYSGFGLRVVDKAALARQPWPDRASPRAEATTSTDVRYVEGHANIEVAREDAQLKVFKLAGQEISVIAAMSASRSTATANKPTRCRANCVATPDIVKIGLVPSVWGLTGPDHDGAASFPAAWMTFGKKKHA
jgi:hypothetical protein